MSKGWGEIGPRDLMVITDCNFAFSLMFRRRVMTKLLGRRKAMIDAATSAQQSPPDRTFAIYRDGMNWRPIWGFAFPADTRTPKDTPRDTA